MYTFQPEEIGTRTGRGDAFFGLTSAGPPGCNGHLASIKQVLVTE